MNFSTNAYDHQQFGVPTKGVYTEILNTQWDRYNGTWQNPVAQVCQSVRLERHHQPWMIEVNVPALGASIFEVEK